MGSGFRGLDCEIRECVMEEKNTSDFKIGVDDEGPDRQFQEEMENIKIEKLSNRITFISVFIPCLIGVIIFLAYLDIKNRVTTVHDTGTIEVQSLSKDLETKLSDLTSKYNQIKNNTSSLKAEIEEATTAIRYIRSARKTDNKKFNTSIAKLEKKITSSTNGLKNISSELKTIDTNFNNKLANLSKTIDKTSKTADKISIELNRLKTDISNLSSVKIDKKALDSALKNEKKLYDQKLDQIKRNIEDIEKKITSTLSTQVKPKTAIPEDKTIKIPTTESGGIIEQDIQ